MFGILHKTKEGYYMLFDENKKWIGVMGDCDGKKLKLSKENCDEIFGVIDVEKLAFNYAIEIGILHTTLAYSKHFKAGFNKAMELNKDKMFTLEDIGKAIMFGRWEATDKAAYNNFIQSLQQTEWDVEIEMEYKDIDELRVDKGSFLKPNDIYKPKLDADGCLILKKKL